MGAKRCVTLLIRAAMVNTVEVPVSAYGSFDYNNIIAREKFHKATYLMIIFLGIFFTARQQCRSESVVRSRDSSSAKERFHREQFVSVTSGGYQGNFNIFSLTFIGSTSLLRKVVLFLQT